MEVFLVRHAQAVDRGGTLRDGYRHLTGHGRAQAKALGERLRWHDCIPDRVWTSPMMRAVQTAEIVLAVSEWNGEIESVPGLAHGKVQGPIATRVRKLPGDARVMIVGHEPELSRLAALLTKRDDLVELEKAEAMRIDGGRVKWYFAWSDEAPRSPT